MGTIFLGLVIVLFLLAISDLVVGVSNDAVNFLNSAIGSKAATFKTIMIIATLGILLGASFSSGMMEVARKGIFHPQNFFFDEIIIIFLAVMITDVILLDLFNTFGMPTSTTVSIVFELLGAAVAISMIKVNGENPLGYQMGDLINSAKALAIISGILLSVAIAFISGLVAQFFGRLVFTFDYEKKLKYLGSVWGGLAITAITYFILVKGAKGSAFISNETAAYIQENTLKILAFSFVAWSVILQIVYLVFRINILRIVVLVGTFALAMAFAGNDLVNFIGVPLAGYEAFREWSAQTNFAANEYLMSGLAGAVKTPPFFLLLAGAIMAVTLWFSKKARSVTETEINLAKQEVGYERFESSMLSRFLVRSFSGIGNISKIVPDAATSWMKNRFDRTSLTDNADTPSFDLLRASVNLFMASILISYATAQKLPLSTTYVTFMVAMGSSLADGAWGRESAVYRISGVLSVIGGWFFTAFMAFSLAFGMALLFHYGGTVGIFAMIAVAIFIIFRTHALHRRREEKKGAMQHESETEDQITSSKLVQKSQEYLLYLLENVKIALGEYLTGLAAEDRKLLKKAYEDFEIVYEKTTTLKKNLNKTVDRLNESALESGYYYARVLENLRNVANSTFFLISPSFEHVSNNHRPLTDDQHTELLNINKEITEFLEEAGINIEQGHEVPSDKLKKERDDILLVIRGCRKNQIKRIKHGTVGTRNSMLFFGLLEESKNLILFTSSLLKSHRDLMDIVLGKKVEEEDI
ncbi:MAG: inorganic phosphate transporter [Saprospiraceae bacterium]|nr:inorganic phosphate transporter [Saprospiraceae bacterium]MCB9322504.1 inorganic phosphate transporter [Lewinellaceae bacterium]